MKDLTERLTEACAKATAGPWRAVRGDDYVFLEVENIAHIRAKDANANEAPFVVQARPGTLGSPAHDAPLIEKLEGLAVPSREVDAEIECELRRYQAYAIGLNDQTRAYWSPVGDKGEVEEGGTRYHAPEYSFSLDAAIALTERVLPGWYWRTGKTSLFPKGWAYISKTHPSHCDREDEASSSDGKAASPAIALLIATLKALEVTRHG